MNCRNIENLQKENELVNNRLRYQTPILEEFAISEYILGGVPQQILESQGGIYDS